MKPEEVLGRWRAGELGAAGDDREAVVLAVRAFADAGDAASALELMAHAWRLWLAGGDMEDASAVAAIALGAPGASKVATWRARVLYADGLFAFREGDMKRSLARNEETLRIARDSGDVRGECDAMTGLARVALREGRYDDVVALAREARALARTAGDPAAEASPLHLEAAGVRLKQDYAAARDLYLESLDVSQKSGDAGRIATEHHNLGWVELHLGNLAQAEERFRNRDAASGADAYSDAWSELNWAAVAAARQRWAEAKSRFVSGTAEIAKLGVALDPDDKFELEWLTSRLAEHPC